jgi:large subunit ribosomal protein L25
MSQATIQVESRNNQGKGPSRQLRARGMVPAVVYGRGGAVSLAVSPKQLRSALSSEHGINTLLTLTNEGKSELAMVKEMQTHPVSREVVHVDFYRVALDEPVQVDVPFAVTGRAAGVVKGGTLQVVFRTLPVLANPDKIPSKITVDVTPLDLHQTFHVSDLQLDHGVKVQLPPKQSLITIEMRKKRGYEEEAAQPGAPGAAAPGAAPAAGATAAKG